MPKYTKKMYYFEAQSDKPEGSGTPKLTNNWEQMIKSVDTQLSEISVDFEKFICCTVVIEEFEDLRTQNAYNLFRLKELISWSKLAAYIREKQNVFKGGPEYTALANKELSGLYEKISSVYKDAVESITVLLEATEMTPQSPAESDENYENRSKALYASKVADIECIMVEMQHDTEKVIDNNILNLIEDRECETKDLETKIADLDEWDVLSSMAKAYNTQLSAESYDTELPLLENYLEQVLHYAMVSPSLRTVLERYLSERIDETLLMIKVATFPPRMPKHDIVLMQRYAFARSVGICLDKTVFTDISSRLKALKYEFPADIIAEADTYLRLKYPGPE